MSLDNHNSKSIKEIVPDSTPFDGDYSPAPGAARTRQATVTEFSDIMIAESTLPGYVAIRNTKEGSWFIKELCQD